MKEPRAFEVTIAAHVVPSRPRCESWQRSRIVEQTHTVVELDEERARMEACRRAHMAASPRVAAWRPYLRESMGHARARRAKSSREIEMERVRRGGRA